MSDMPLAMLVYRAGATIYPSVTIGSDARKCPAGTTEIARLVQTEDESPQAFFDRANAVIRAAAARDRCDRVEFEYRRRT